MHNLNVWNFTISNCIEPYQTRAYLIQSGNRFFFSSVVRSNRNGKYCLQLPSFRCEYACWVQWFIDNCCLINSIQKLCKLCSSCALAKKTDSICGKLIEIKMNRIFLVVGDLLFTDLYFYIIFFLVVKCELSAATISNQRWMAAIHIRWQATKFVSIFWFSVLFVVAWFVFAPVLLTSGKLCDGQWQRAIRRHANTIKSHTKLVLYIWISI